MTLAIRKELTSVIFGKCLLPEYLSRKFTIFLPLSTYKANFRGKHWQKQILKEKKVLKVILPDFDEKGLYTPDEKLSLEKMRSWLKEKGVTPHKEWKEKPMYINCTDHIMDPFVPPEGDGKVSFVATQDSKQLFDDTEMKEKSLLALRKIRNIDCEFDVPCIAEKGKDLYIEAQKALEDKNEEKLHELVTEKGFTEMMESTRLKTIRWNFIQSLEPPRIVHIRCGEMISKENIFAQVTLRVFSQQTLAIYDRFGRLEYGSEETLKDVLEYIVFEKHITRPQASWRIHGKIIPNWLLKSSIPKETIDQTKDCSKYGRKKSTNIRPKYKT